MTQQPPQQQSQTSAGASASQPPRRTARSSKIDRLLELARTHLQMDLAWISHFDLDPTRPDAEVPDAQVLDHVNGQAAAMGVQAGDRLERSGSFCVRVLAGGLPAAVTDARRHPVTRDLPVTKALGIGSYLGAPLHDRHGQVSGMLCVLSRTPTPDLDGPASSFLALVADLISDYLIEDGPQELAGNEPATATAGTGTTDEAGQSSVVQPDRAKPSEDQPSKDPVVDEVVDHVRAVLDRDSIQMVFQPVWQLPDAENSQNSADQMIPPRQAYPNTAAGSSTNADTDTDPSTDRGASRGGQLRAAEGRPGRRVVAYEALARFPDTIFTRPDLAFAAATRAGLGVELERLAARTALAQLHRIPPGTLMCVNLSAEAITDLPTQDVLLRACAQARRSGRMVGVEVTEHTQVADYAELAAATGRLSAAGAYIVIDDAGAGYASFSHILQLHPDVIKIDISLIRDIDTDPVKKALTRALAAFADEISAYLVAEGVERLEEAATVQHLGVRLVQGYLYGRPEPLPLPAAGSLQSTAESLPVT